MDENPSDQLNSLLVQKRERAVMRSTKLLIHSSAKRAVGQTNARKSHHQFTCRINDLKGY